MKTMKVRDAELEYEVRENASGDVLFIHGGVIEDAFSPVISELTSEPQSDGYRILHFHRRGYGGSSKPPPGFSVEEQAKDCLALMDATHLAKAHLVSHSMTGLVALHLATVAPERVSGITLIEPALTGFLPSAQQQAQHLQRVGALYQSGDKAGAMDVFLTGISGSDYRSAMDKVLPEAWFDQALRAVDTFFQADLPAARSWKPDLQEMRRQVSRPILSIYGTLKRWDDTSDVGKEMDGLVHSWFPQAETLAVEGAYHWPHLSNTAEVAKGLTAFLKRHPR